MGRRIGLREKVACDARQMPLKYHATYQESREKGGGSGESVYRGIH